MPGYWLSEQELQALAYVPINAQIIYMRGLRPKMASNGVVGYGKRALRWQDLAVLINEDMTRKQVRVQLEHLKKNNLTASPNTVGNKTNSIFLKLPLASPEGPAKGPVETEHNQSYNGQTSASCPQMAAYSQYPELQRGQQQGQNPAEAIKLGPVKGPVESQCSRGVEQDSVGIGGQQKGHIINQYLIKYINTSSIKRWAEQERGFQLTDDDVVLLDQAVSNLGLSNRFMWRADDPKHMLSLIDLVIQQRATSDELTVIRTRAESFVKGDRWQIQYAHSVLRSIRQELPTQSVESKPQPQDPATALKNQAREISQEISGLEQLGGEAVAPQIQAKRQVLRDIEQKIQESTEAVC